MKKNQPIAVVTGGAGFIGSHVVNLLLDKGYSVRVLDSFVSGKKERLPLDKISVIPGDIRDPAILETAMQSVTLAVHLAALVSVPGSMADPELTRDVNVIGTQNVLKAARRSGIKRLVYASSAAVYGDHPELPKTEKSPLRPQSPYAASKVSNEEDAHRSGLPAIGLRFFNVYGPGQDANHPYASVIPRWVHAVRAGGRITLYGDGSQTRDFVHVRDVARAICDALFREVSGVFNIASGEETSLEELKRIIAEVSKRAVEVEYKPVREGDILRSVADISAARRMLDFSPSIGLQDGIAELLAP